MPHTEHHFQAQRADRIEQRLFSCLQHCCVPASSGQAHLSYLPPHKGNQPRPISPSPPLLPCPPQDIPSISLPLLECQEAPSCHLYLMTGAPQKSLKTNISTNRRPWNLISCGFVLFTISSPPQHTQMPLPSHCSVVGARFSALPTLHNNECDCTYLTYLDPFSSKPGPNSLSRG